MKRIEKNKFEKNTLKNKIRRLKKHLRWNPRNKQARARLAELENL